MAQATISKVSLVNTANGPRIALNLSNGDTQWYPQSYINKLLIANFMEGARPTVLIGTEVEFTKQSYAVGDAVTDEKGQAVVPALTHKKAGVKLVNFTFGEIAGRVSEFDKAQMNAQAVAQAVSSNPFIAMATSKQRVIEQVEPETAVLIGDEVHP